MAAAGIALLAGLRWRDALAPETEATS
jgi:hypothetical protein